MCICLTPQCHPPNLILNQSTYYCYCFIQFPVCFSHFPSRKFFLFQLHCLTPHCTPDGGGGGSVVAGVEAVGTMLCVRRWVVIVEWVSGSGAERGPGEPWQEGPGSACKCCGRRGSTSACRFNLTTSSRSPLTSGSLFPPHSGRRKGEII